MHTLHSTAHSTHTPMTLVVFSILYRFLHTNTVLVIGCACVVLIYILQFKPLISKFVLVSPKRIASMVFPAISNRFCQCLTRNSNSTFLHAASVDAEFKLICFYLLDFTLYTFFPSICAVERHMLD